MTLAARNWLGYYITQETIMSTTRAANSDNSDASQIATHPSASDEERIAAAHIMAAYDLRTVCERSNIATVQTAGQRLGLW